MAEPILAIGPEAGPVDGSAQLQGRALEPDSSPNLPPHAANHILVRMHLAAGVRCTCPVLIVGAGVPGWTSRVCCPSGGGCSRVCR